ncbi:hypothetical protein Emag_007134 [Eimeria magna]
MDGGRGGGGPPGNDGGFNKPAAEKASGALRGQRVTEFNTASVSPQGLADSFRALAACPEEGPQILKYARRSRGGPHRGGEGRGAPSSPLGDNSSLRGGPPFPSYIRGPLSLGGPPSEAGVSFELPAGRQQIAAEGGAGYYTLLSANNEATGEEGWFTECTTDSAQDEASLGMQLSMLYEATRWFPQTSYYARMHANAQPQVDKKQAHRDAELIAPLDRKKED